MFHSKDSNTGLFSMMPDTEVAFAVSKASEILHSLEGDHSLESILKATTEAHGSNEYGWEEAILSKKWYRWPSETTEQQFCSEEALKNYVFLKALRIPAWYGVLEGFQGGDMVHEIVFVPSGDDLYALHWNKAEKVSIESDSVVTEENKLGFKALSFLEEQEVVDRVHKLRNGTSFLDSVEVGQKLFEKDSTAGHLDAFVKYNPERQELRFLYVFTRLGLFTQKVYLEHRSFVQNGDVQDEQILGICDHFGYVTKNKVPIMRYKDGAMAWRNKDYFNSLDPEKQIQVCFEVGYDWRTYLEGTFDWPEEERAAAIEKMRENCENGTSLPAFVGKGILLIYDSYAAAGKKEIAERFMDITLSGISFHGDPLAQTPEDAQDVLERAFSISPDLRDALFQLMSMRDMGAIFSGYNALECSNLLTNELSQRSGIPFRPLAQNTTFEMMDFFGSTTKDDWYNENSRMYQNLKKIVPD